MDRSASDELSTSSVGLECGGVYLRRGSPDDVPTIVELQTVLFPVRYANSFYENLFKPRHYIIVACSIDTNEIVGVVSARLERCERLVDTFNPFGSEKWLGYIMTIGVAEVYRCRGIGSRLLQTIIKLLESDPECVIRVRLHVLSSNLTAQRFYTGLGFEKGARMRDHYTINGQLHDADEFSCAIGESRSAFIHIFRRIARVVCLICRAPILLLQQARFILPMHAVVIGRSVLNKAASRA